MGGRARGSGARGAALAVALLLLLARPLPAAEAVRAVDAEGLARTLAGARGKVVVLNFWATWCEPCREEFPDLVRFARENRDRLTLITVSLDLPDDADGPVRTFLDSMKTPGITLIKAPGDPDPFINSIDPGWSGALPATFIYDRAGERTHGVHGAVTYEMLSEMAAPLLEDGGGP